MQFSRALYNKYDGFGKNVAMSFLIGLGHKVVNTDEAYGSHDFITEINNEKKKIEVEVKNGWKTFDFPFSTHDVPYRKRTSNADLFIQVNAEGTALCMCPMRDVKASSLIKKNTIYTNNEMFYAVPVSKMQYFIKQGDRWIETITNYRLG